MCIPEVIKSKLLAYQKGLVQIFPSWLQDERRTVFAYHIRFSLGIARRIAYRNAVQVVEVFLSRPSLVVGRWRAVD